MKGLPLVIIGDRDKLFTAKYFENFIRRLGCDLRLSSARSQQTNGMVERKNAVLEEVIRNGINYKQDNWCELLPFATFAINQSPTPALAGRSPLFYERGFNPITPIDLIGSLPVKRQDDCPTGVLERAQYLHDMRVTVKDAIHEANKNYEYYYNLKKRPATNIVVGSHVRLNLDHIKLPIFKNRPRSKLNPIWYGPFEVIGQPSPVSYKLKLPHNVHIHDVFHVSKLKPASSTSFSNMKPIVIPTDSSQDGEYELDQILDHRLDKRSKTWMYLVSWKGYSPLFSSTWEPRQHLDNAKEMRDAYDAKHDIVV